VALTAAAGTLTLGATAGLRFEAGDGTADPSMTFAGTLAQVNTALTGLTFTPTPQFNGPARVTITVHDDGSGGAGPPASGTAAIPITVTAVDDPPAAVADTYSVVATDTLTVPAPGVLGNDTDVDAAPGSLSAVLVANAAHGTVNLGATGGFTYTPAAGYAGPDSFTYRASDGVASSNPVTVSITVTPTRCVPRPKVTTSPVAGGGKLAVHVESTALNTPANNPLQQLTFTRLQNATVTLDGQPIANGQTYTVPADRVGIDFTVARVTPGQATTVELTVVDGCGEWKTFVGGGTAASF
jgi:hypothetical protein